jgi:hypothetical protein
MRGASKSKVQIFSLLGKLFPLCLAFCEPMNGLGELQANQITLFVMGNRYWMCGKIANEDWSRCHARQRSRGYLYRDQRR